MTPIKYINVYNVFILLKVIFMGMRINITSTVGSKVCETLHQHPGPTLALKCEGVACDTMASPGKRKSHDMSAYIVSMSPVKMSKNNNPYLKGKFKVVEINIRISLSTILGKRVI